MNERKWIKKGGLKQARVARAEVGRGLAGRARRRGQDAVKNQGRGDRDATKEGHDNCGGRRRAAAKRARCFSPERPRAF